MSVWENLAEKFRGEHKKSPESATAGGGRGDGDGGNNRFGHGKGEEKGVEPPRQEKPETGSQGSDRFNV